MRVSQYARDEIDQEIGRAAMSGVMKADENRHDFAQTRIGLATWFPSIPAKLFVFCALFHHQTEIIDIPTQFE